MATTNLSSNYITVGGDVTTPSIQALYPVGNQDLFTNATALINTGTATSTLTTAGGISTNTLEPNAVATLVNAYTTHTGKMQIGSSSNTGVATNVGICVAPITTGTVRTISVGKTTVDSVHVANVEHTGPAIGNATAPAAGLFEICTAQTTGILNIGTGTRTGVGAINIGTGSTSSAINIGNKTTSTNSVVINSGSAGILLASNNAVAGRGIKITDNTVDVAIATETLSIGATTGGAINIGTGMTSSAITIGNKTTSTNSVVINSGSAGILLASNNATTGRGINVKDNTVDVAVAADTLSVGTTNATGGITIGNGTQTNITVGGITIGNGNIQRSAVTDALTIAPNTTTGNLSLGVAQTTGILDIGTGTRTTTGAINIGTGITTASINIGKKTATASNVNILAGTGGINLVSGSATADGIKVSGTVIDTVIAESLSFGTATANNVNIGKTSTGATTVNNALTATGLTTVNGGLTVGGSNNITLGNGTVSPATSANLGFSTVATGSVVLAVGFGNNVCNTGSLAAGTWLIIATFDFPGIAGRCFGWINTVSATFAGNKGLIAVYGEALGTSYTTSYVFKSTAATTYYAISQLETTAGTVGGTISAVRLA
jgi:hypothetical protein